MDVRVIKIDPLLTIQDVVHGAGYCDWEWIEIFPVERSISIGPPQLRKVVHLERWTDFFEASLVELNQSIKQIKKPNYKPCITLW